MQGAMAVIKSCRLLCVCVFLCSPLFISLSDESLDMTNYSKASCDFEEPCYWTNVERSEFSLIWDYTDSWGDDYAFLDMEGKSSGEKGRLSSPWLPSLATILPTTENSQLTHQTQCRLQFKYSIGISDNCRLSLLLEDEDRITATNRSDNDDHGKVLWSSSQAIGDSYFSDVQSVDIPCLHTRKYRMTFEGQKLTNGPCGQSTWFNPDNNRIKLDNVFLTWPTDDPTTTTPDPTEDYDSDDLSGDVDDDNFENEDADLASTLSSTPTTTTSRTSESNDLTTTDSDSDFSYYTTASASIHGISHHDDSDKIDLVSGSDSNDDIIISDVDSPMETQTHSIDPSSSSSARDIEDDDDFDDDSHIIVDSGVTKHDDGHDENYDVITDSAVDDVKNEDSHPSFGVTPREGKHEGEVERHRTKTSTTTTTKTSTTTTAMTTTTTTTMMSTKEQDDVLTGMVTKSVSVSESSDPTMMMFIGIIIAASVGVVVIIIVVVVTAIICHRRRKRRESIEKNSRSRNGDIISAVSLSKGDIFVISDPEVQNGDLRSHPHRHTPPVNVGNTPTAPPPHPLPSQPSPVPPVIAGGPCASRNRHMVSSTDHNKLDIPNGHI